MAWGAPGFVETNTRPASSSAAHNEAEGQEIPVSGWPWSTLSLAQVDPPPVGLLELSTSPASSTAKHRDADAHDTAVRLGGVEEGLAPGTVPVEPELVVSPKVSTVPSKPTATHSAVDVHDTPASGRSVAPPPVQAPSAGSVDVTILPHCARPPKLPQPPAMAPQNDADAQDTSVNGAGHEGFIPDGQGSLTGAGVDVNAGWPLPGFGQATNEPLSIATHNAADEHDTASSANIECS